MSLAIIAKFQKVLKVHLLTYHIDSNPSILDNYKAKVEIDLIGATVLAATQQDKIENKKIDPDKSFKVLFDSNAIIGNKPCKKPKKEIWNFTLSTIEERDKWLEVLDLH